MLSQDVVDALFPPDLPEPDHWEHRYPPRDLAEGAKVTRFSPSPTGFLHIGGVYAATIDVDVARQSGGVYLVRLEDTDQARVAEGAAEQFAEAFAYFSIGPDEDDQTGRYGPYSQSARARTYLTYVRELLRQGRAYPCFATRQDLEEITARQRAAGAHLPPRARGGRPPDASQPGHPRRGVDLLGPASPAAVRRPRLRAGRIRAHRPADEAGRRQPPQAVEAPGPGRSEERR